MKKLFLLIPYIAFSLHAMEKDACIIEYNADKHGKIVETIFFEAFPHVKEAPEELTNPANYPTASVVVLEHDNKPAGFAMWENENVPFNQAFSDVHTYKQSKASLNVLRLNYLAIDKKFRRTTERTGKRFGERLLLHVGTIARKNDQDIIALNAELDSMPFYEKYKYVKTNADQECHLMALPLNENIKDVLDTVKSVRAENKKNRKGLRFTRFLI